MMDAVLAGNHTFENAETLAQDVAEWLCGLAQASGRAFAVCLSGGSTPRRLYELLATPEIAGLPYVVSGLVAAGGLAVRLLGAG